MADQAGSAGEHPPVGHRLTRLARNFVHDPRRFVRSVVRRRVAPVARHVFWFVPGRTTVPTVHDQRSLPSASIVAVLGADGVDDLLAPPFGHNTELVLLVDGRDRAHIDGWLSQIRARACRIYVFEHHRSREEMLRYGLSRAYGRRIALRAATGAAPDTALADGVRALRELAATATTTSLATDVTALPDGRFVDTGPLLMLDQRAARELVTGDTVRNDLAAAFARCGSSAASTRSAEPAARAAPEARAGGLASVGDSIDAERLSGFFVYRAPPPGAVFAAPADQQGIVCLERKPPWFRRMPPRKRGCDELVTVIMTVYNGAATLETAIDSVLHQTHRNIEVLVVDDGSTDDSIAIVTRIQRRDGRVRLLRTQANGGTYVARNVGLRHATGDFVTFQDADDVSLGHRIEYQVAALHADPHAWANMLRYQRVSDDTGRVLWLGVHKDRTAFVSLLLRRRQVLDTVGFFDSVRVGADSELVLRLTAVTGRRPQVLPLVGYIARHAHGSLTTSGAGHIALAADGSVTMPPARIAYRDAAERWHAAIARGDASAYVAFPLLERPFPAPEEIVVRGPAADGADEQIRAQ